MAARDSALIVWNVVAALALATLGFALSAPGAYFLTAAIGFLLSLVAAGGWIFTLGFRLWRGTMRWRWHVAVAPALIAAILVAGWASLPLKVRFAQAQTAFDQAVAGVEPTTQDCSWIRGEQRIGTFGITSTTRVDDVTLFAHRSGFIFSTTGFAHSPAGPPSTDAARYAGCGFETINFDHISGDWYEFIAGDSWL